MRGDDPVGIVRRAIERTKKSITSDLRERHDPMDNKIASALEDFCNTLDTCIILEEVENG